MVAELIQLERRFTEKGVLMPQVDQFDRALPPSISAATKFLWYFCRLCGASYVLPEGLLPGDCSSCLAVPARYYHAEGVYPWEKFNKAFDSKKARILEMREKIVKGDF